MPVWQIGPKPRPAVDQQLLERLLAEWQNPGSDVRQPIIMEERDDRTKHITKIYVIWDEWAHLSGVERSELIMEACEQRYGVRDAALVLVAMGLTSEQAERLKWMWHKLPRGGTNLP